MDREPWSKFGTCLEMYLHIDIHICIYCNDNDDNNDDLLMIYLIHILLVVYIYI